MKRTKLLIVKNVNTHARLAIPSPFALPVFTTTPSVKFQIMKELAIYNATKGKNLRSRTNVKVVPIVTFVKLNRN